MGLQLNGTTIVDDNRQGFFNNANVNYSSIGAVTFQASPYYGTVAGYTSGGLNATPGPSTNNIDRFSFASDSSIVDYTDTSPAGLFESIGASSEFKGYIIGGEETIRFKSYRTFNFANKSAAIEVGNLSNEIALGAGHSSTTHGYVSGGYNPSLPGGFEDDIIKFSFAFDSSSVKTGVLTASKYDLTGASSITHGYTMGGFMPGAVSSAIEKFPFAVDSNATNIGTLQTGGTGLSLGVGVSSKNSGYYVGSITPSPTNFQINKFPFATDNDTTGIGNLTVQRQRSSSSSSESFGYIQGGQGVPGSSVNVVDKFPFATDTNATDVGDLSVARYSSSGQQD